MRKMIVPQLPYLNLLLTRYLLQNEDAKSNAGSGSDVGSDEGSEVDSPVNRRRGRGRSVDDIIDDEDVINFKRNLYLQTAILMP